MPKRTYEPVGELSRDMATYASDGRFIGAGRMTTTLVVCSECRAVVTDHVHHDRWHDNLQCDLNERVINGPGGT